MKVKYLPLFIASFIFNFNKIITAQQLTIVATSSSGIMDTLICGYEDGASLGIDANLGEQNIFNEPINDFEGRILQRNEVNYSCAVNVDGQFQIVYEDNFDSKVNLRDINEPSLANRIFELRYSDNQLSQLKISSDVELMDFLRLLVYLEDCDSILPVFELDITEPTQVIEMNSPPFLTFKEVMLEIDPSFLTNSHVPDSKAFDVLVYPNPVSTFLNIEYPHLNGESLDFRLYSTLGQLVLQDYHSNNAHSINVASLKSGLYFYEISSKEIVIEKGKIIKQ